MSTKNSQPISIRLDTALLKTIKKWLNKHPGFSMSSLTTIALQKFVTNDQILEGVESMHAPKIEVQKSLKKMMKTHKKTLDELK